MAEHIDSVAASSIPKVDKARFYEMVRSGDLVFCSGDYRISGLIRDETESPFSHVLQLWLPHDSDVWLTLESTAAHGVHVGELSEYTDKYNGDLVLTRRTLTGEAIRRIRERILGVLDDRYDWIQEVSIAGHNLIKALPVVVPRKEYFCSGLQYYGSLAALPALQRPGEGYPTPEDNWTDPSVAPVCALMKH